MLIFVKLEQQLHLTAVHCEILAILCEHCVNLSQIIIFKKFSLTVPVPARTYDAEAAPTHVNV